MVHSQPIISHQMTHLPWLDCGGGADTGFEDCGGVIIFPLGGGGGNRPTPPAAGRGLCLPSCGFLLAYNRQCDKVDELNLH